MIWRILDRKHANMVVFGVAGMKKIEIIKIFIKNNFISFSKPKIKDKHIDARIYKDRHLIVEKPKDCFSGILIDFINENIPTPLIERFEFMVNNYNNHRNADCFVASPGLYDDEQLFELAMGRYNGARIVNVHEAGNGLDKFSCSSNFLYKPFDMYYSWGYLSHVGYDEFKSAPSRLSVIKNAHKSSNDIVLYLTKFPLIYSNLYDSIIIYDWKKYFNNRELFVQNIQNKGLDTCLQLKLHHTRKKGFDEIAAMQNYNFKVTYHSDPNINILTAKIIYFDYLSTALYEVIASNTPFIMSIDTSITQPSSELEKYIEIMKDAKIFFDNPREAAIFISSIYDDIDSFWASEKVQDFRGIFLSDFLHLTDNWTADLIGVISLDLDKNNGVKH